MAKKKSNKDLYGRLRASGIRKKVARMVSQALPDSGPKKSSIANRVADELSAAADSIRELAGDGPRKRSEAAKKAARTRKANAAKRSASAKKSTKTRAKS